MDFKREFGETWMQMNVSTDDMDGTDEYLVFDFPILNSSADNS